MTKDNFLADAVTSEFGDRQSIHPVKNPASIFWQVFRGVARCCLPRFPCISEVALQLASESPSTDVFPCISEVALQLASESPNTDVLMLFCS